MSSAPKIATGRPHRVALPIGREVCSMLEDAGSGDWGPFENLEDPRVERTLQDVVVISVTAWRRERAFLDRAQPRHYGGFAPQPRRRSHKLRGRRDAASSGFRRHSPLHFTAPLRLRLTRPADVLPEQAREKCSDAATLSDVPSSASEHFKLAPRSSATYQTSGRRPSAAPPLPMPVGLPQLTVRGLG